MFLLKEWTAHSLSRGLVIKLKVADAHFLVSVVELTPFLSISVFLVLVSVVQTRKQSPEEMGLLV